MIHGRDESISEVAVIAFFAVRWFPLAGMPLEKHAVSCTKKVAPSSLVVNIYFSFRTNLNAMFLSREIVQGGTL